MTRLTFVDLCNRISLPPHVSMRSGLCGRGTEAGSLFLAESASRRLGVQPALWNWKGQFWGKRGWGSRQFQGLSLPCAQRLAFWWQIVHLVERPLRVQPHRLRHPFTHLCRVWKC